MHVSPASRIDRAASLAFAAHAIAACMVALRLQLTYDNTDQSRRI